MLWHNDSIRSAVDKVKSSGAILLVFVHGDDILSKKYEVYLNDNAKFEADNYVALKVSHSSVAYKQFEQIYVNVPVPSLFIIQNNGRPLKVIQSDQITDLHSAIQDGIEKQKNSLKIINNFDVKQNSHTQTNKKSTKEVTKKPSQHVKNVGHKIFIISDEEIKKRLKELRGFPRFLSLDGPSSSAPELTLPKSTPKSQSARIQFRLPTNETPSWEFPNLSTLGDVKAYLIEQKKISQNFKLLRTFPRKSFTPQEESKTLEELSLVPNATLIVVPVQDATVQAKVKNLIVHPSFVSTLIKTLMQPIFVLVNYIKRVILKQPVESNNRPKRLPSDTSTEKMTNKKTSTSNIHGFKFKEDSDSDGENPDNGNSTQQRFQKK